VSFVPFEMMLMMMMRALLTIFRGINEGRQAARQVDTYLMGIGSQLPVTGGIVRRAQIDSVPRPHHVARPEVSAAA
jgi:hypothetical protein